MSLALQSKTKRTSVLPWWLLGAVVALTAFFVFRARSDQQSLTAISSSVSDKLAVGTPRPNPDEPVITRDPAAVFQRAFWRRPTADSRVLHGERREWLDASSTVQKWEWYVAVQTSPEFRAWLVDQNPFEISRAATPVDPAEMPHAPDWFPAPSTWPALTAYRSRGSKLVVLLDPTSGRLFAADHGAGFAAPTR